MDWVRSDWFLFIPVFGIVFLGLYAFARSMHYNYVSHAALQERRKNERTRGHGCH